MRSRPRVRTRSLAVLALAGVLVFTGCTGEDEPSVEEAGGTATVDDAGGTAAPDDSAQSAGPVEPPTEPADIRPVDGERSASGDGSITIEGNHAGFVLPSGTIACSVTAASAVCQVVSDQGFSVNPDHLAQENLPGCDASNANAIRLVSGRGAWTCVPEGLLGQAAVGAGGWWVDDVGGTTLDEDGLTLAVLPYGSSLSVGSVTCSSAESGVSCGSDELGEQFVLSRGSYSYS